MNVDVKPASLAAARTDGSGLMVRDATVTYRNGFTALRSASFAIPTGTITALVGVNGSGKSTLMRAVVGPDMGVKASGGVRTQADAQAMIQAGATRIGASASVAIISGKVGSGGY